MKTKEQKRQEAQARVDKILTERLEIGAVQQFRNRLEKIKKRPGKSEREVLRLTRKIKDLEDLQKDFETELKSTKSTSEQKRLQKLIQQKSKKVDK